MNVASITEIAIIQGLKLGTQSSKLTALGDASAAALI
jgi:hypothetical protein